MSGDISLLPHMPSDLATLPVLLNLLIYTVYSIFIIILFYELLLLG
jgi:hypothetical protein